MRLLVCGGRNYTDAKALNARLDALVKERGRVSVLIHGAARGADSLAAAWAAENGIPVLAFPADWDTYGKAAGAIRNSQMLTDGQPDLVVAFPGGAGTANMVRQSWKARVPVISTLDDIQYGLLLDYDG